MIDDSGCGGAGLFAGISPRRRSNLAVAAATPPPRCVLRTEGEGQSLRRADRATPAAVSTPRRHHGGRRLLLAVFLRLHRRGRKGRCTAIASMAVTSQRFGVETCGHARGRRLLSPRPNCSSPMDLATISPFRCGSAPPACAERAAPRPRRPASPLIERHRPTLYFGVPTLYAALSAAFRQSEKPDLSSVRSCVSAGEALPSADSPALARGNGSLDSGRHRLDRSAAHFHLEHAPAT